MYNPINDRINNLMNQKQMIESQLQNIQQLANIPPININNQITPNMALNDFNGKWVNNEQEAEVINERAYEMYNDEPVNEGTLTLTDLRGASIRKAQNEQIQGVEKKKKEEEKSSRRYYK